MALQGSGPISLANIATEFGGSAPHSITEYYRGGGLVPNSTANANVPTSGAISLSNFYNASAITIANYTGTGNYFRNTDSKTGIYTDYYGFTTSSYISPTTFKSYNINNLYQFHVNGIGPYYTLFSLGGGSSIPVASEFQYIEVWTGGTLIKTLWSSSATFRNVFQDWQWSDTGIWMPSSGTHTIKIFY